MSRRLPPLYALRAFEAAARHASFTRAAAELAITQSAVSRHIRTLEEHFGCRLFERSGRHLQLTETARGLLPGMRERRRGAIINVASMAGLVPGSAGSTLYGGAKSMLIKFSQSLSLETSGRGIRVQALCPGFTHSTSVTSTPALPAMVRPGSNISSTSQSLVTRATISA